MTDDFVKELRRFSFHDRIIERPWEAVELIDAAADRIEWMQDIIARIQHTNLRRDMNIKNRTLEIDRLCKTK